MLQHPRIGPTRPGGQSVRSRRRSISSLLALVGALILIQSSPSRSQAPAACNVTDGRFTLCRDGSLEWSDTVPVSFPETHAYLYAKQADLDPNRQTPTSPVDTLMLLYDNCGETTPLESNQYVRVAFKTVEVEDGVERLEIYVVHIFGDGTILFVENGVPSPSGRVREIEGQRGIARFGVSPNCAIPHVIAEYDIELEAAGGHSYSPDPIFWSAEVVPPPDPEAPDLSLAKTLTDLTTGVFDPPSIAPGDLLAYTLTVTNVGNNDAHNVSLVDMLSVDVGHRSDTCGGRTSGTAWSASLGTVAANTSVSCTIEALFSTTSALTVLPNVARVSGDGDGNSVNNAASLSTPVTVFCPPALGRTKTERSTPGGPVDSWLIDEQTIADVSVKSICVDVKPAIDCRVTGSPCDEHFSFLVDNVPCAACIFDGGQNQSSVSINDRTGALEQFVHLNSDNGPSVENGDDDGDGRLDELWFVFDLVQHSVTIRHDEDGETVPNGTLVLDPPPATEAALFNAAFNLLQTTGNFRFAEFSLSAAALALPSSRCSASTIYDDEEFAAHASRELGIDIVLPNRRVVPGTLFGTDARRGNLLTVDPVQGVGAVVGPMGIGVAPSLAADPVSGHLFAGSGGGSASIFLIDPATGRGTLIGSTNLGFAAVGGMDFDPNGTLFAAVNILGDGGTGSEHLATIDTSTGVVTLRGPFGTCSAFACSIEGMEAIAFAPDGTLYGAVSGRGPSAGLAGLYRISTATGAAEFVAAIADATGVPLANGVVSLEFVGPTLYGGTIDGRLITINASTGRFRAVGAGRATIDSSLGALAFAQPFAADRDGDGVPDEVDGCPDLSNADQEDRNLNGIGDACEAPGLKHATAVFLQTLDSGGTTVEAHTLGVADEPPLALELARIVEFRVESGRAASAPELIANLVDSLVDARLVTTQEAEILVDEVMDLVNQPPVCGPATASPDVLWPPDHRMVPIAILGVTDEDGDPISLSVTGVSQNEPASGHEPDVIVGKSGAIVRAERLGNGSGRVYAIEFAATDGKGGQCTGRVFVRVPHSRKE